MTFVTENMALLTGRPEHVEALKQHILSLAVRGLLVPQEAGDEPAGEVLKRIRAEKAKLKKAEVLPPVGADERPYELPEGWVWCKLGEVTNYGETIKIEPGEVDDETWVLELEDVEKVTSKLLARVRYKDRKFKSSKNAFLPNDVIYGKLRPYLDKVVIADEAGVCTTEMLPLRGYPGVSPGYLRVFLKSPEFIEYADGATHGMNLPRLGTEKGKLALFPLPPLPEQHRIVAKVASLFALIDRLSAAVREGEETRRRWLGALLRDLGEARSGEEVRTRWGQLSAHFDELIDSVEAVKALRQVILQLAVRGVLVEQEAGEEPAFELLKKIKAEKAKMGKKGEVLAPVGEEERPYGLPRGWEWCRLGDFSNVVRGGSPRPAGDPRFYDGKIPFLKVGDLTSDDKVFLTTYTHTIKEAGLKKTRVVGPNTVMLTNSGATLGVPKICTFQTTFNDGIAAFLNLPEEVIDKVYLFYFLKSRSMWFLNVASRGQGQPNLNTDIIKNTPFPLPPLSEQRRIVERVERLMGWCDGLEALIGEREGVMGRVVKGVALDLG